MATVIRGSDNFDTADNATQTELDAKATLSHNGSTKLATTSTGIDVTGTVTADASLLAAISDSSTITGTAVDYFIYRAEDDTDPTWRDRCSHTSWYNETLNTATRGSRREFPWDALIVAESDTVTIYDLDSGTPEMWMVMESGTAYYMLTSGGSASTISSIVMREGALFVGTSNSAGMNYVDFNVDEGGLYFTSGKYRFSKNISGRNSVGSIALTNNSASIVNNTVNDVAITVLPNAPIDSATELPVPARGVATNGGLNIIADSIITIRNTYGTQTYTHIEFGDDMVVAAAYNTSTGNSYVFVVDGIPSSNIEINFETTDHSGITLIRTGNVNWNGISSVITAPPYGSSNDINGLEVDGDYIYIGTAQGLLRVHFNRADPSLSSVSQVSSKFSTGEQFGDIKSAFCVDTDVTSLSGSELVESTWSGASGTTPPTGWSSSGTPTFSVASGQLTIDRNGEADPQAVLYKTISSLIVGNTYLVSVNVIDDGVSNSFHCYVDTTIKLNGVTQGVHSFEFVATATSHVLRFAPGGSTTNTAIIDEALFVTAVQDRSVNGNHIGVHGTLTVTNQDGTAAADNDELKVVSGWSGSNFLQQPHNSDISGASGILSGDFTVEFWLKVGAASVDEVLLNIASSGGGNERVYVAIRGDEKIRFSLNDGTTTKTLDSSAALITDVWLHCCLVKRGNYSEIWINGDLENSLDVSTLGSLSNTSALMRIGYRLNDTFPATNQTIDSRIRVVGGAISAEEIKRIYNEERPMFYADSKVVFEGSTDAVADLSHNSETDELHVATSTDKSVFKGLVRVDESTNNVTLTESAGEFTVDKY